jgi:hypothetical protein
LQVLETIAADRFANQPREASRRTGLQRSE